MNLFENFGLSHETLETIKKMGFTKPTQIQERSIPHILKGENVIGESATGSGKTLAFGCGIVENSIPKGGLQALVLTPTRELAEQVKDSLARLAGYKRLKVAAVYGGVSINPQIDALRHAEVVVATPGRMLDHLQRGTINTSKIKIFVLDEADRMLDMGFIDDVERIIKACPSREQTLFFSATIPPSIKRLASRYMENPVSASAKNLVDPEKLEQIYYDVPKGMRLSLLIHSLKEEKEGLAMVFCNTRRTVSFLAANLRANGINAVAIHGGLSQSKRMNNIKMFNEGRKEVLICTDVAARGLHIEHVSYIYNYDLPSTPKDYVHRIGRTARAGEEGKAINLLSEQDHDSFSRILSDYSTFNIKKTKRPYLERIVPIKTRFEDNDRRRSSSWQRRKPRRSYPKQSYSRRG